MSLSLTLTPGYLLADDELLTPAILRLIAQPTVDLTGGLGSTALADGSVTTAKLAGGALSADTAGRSKMADGFLTLTKIASGIFTNDTAGRAPFATGWLSLALVGTGIFTNTPAGRAPFGDGLLTAALHQPDAYWYGVSTGSGAAYVLAFNPTLASYLNGIGGQAYTAYWDGLVVCLKAVAASAAAATLDAGLGVKGIYRQDGTAVQAGDILSGSVVELRYNTSLASGAGGWHMIAPPAAPFAAYYRAGVATCVGTTALVVAFSTPVANTNYAVTLSLQSAPGDSTQLVYVTNKTTSGFTLTQYDVAATQTYNYIVLPNA